MSAAVAVAAGAIGFAAGPPTATAAPAVGTGEGYLSTNGTDIVDANGDVVRLTGVNWFGLETPERMFHGLWASTPWRYHIDTMADLGYNTIRVPYSNDILKPGATVGGGINTASNADLLGLTPLEILDTVIDYAGTKGMRVILDRHRPTGSGQSSLWYTGDVPESKWISDWQFLAEHYAGDTTVIGADLHNEPHAEGVIPNPTGACWTNPYPASDPRHCDPERDWRAAAERAGNAIHEVNPDWLIIVEGVSTPSGGTAPAWIPPGEEDRYEQNTNWWGGYLALAGDYPVELDVANKLVYSPHDYANSVFSQQPWFEDDVFPASLVPHWDEQWGYLVDEGIAPVLVGEFGSTLRDPEDRVWLPTLLDYLDTKGISWTYWSWNPNSGDTLGILEGDWFTVDRVRQDVLDPYLNFPPVPGPGSTPSPTPTTPGPTSTTPGPTSTTPMPAGDCSAVVSVANAWPGGFQAAITVTAGSSPLTGWTLTFPAAGYTIADAWGTRVTVSGGTVTAENASWNGSLPAGGTATAGFNGSGTAPSGVTASCEGS
ncbi:MAG: cellulase family glycosylhydrolase [Kineosporiaceae bacterium]